MNAPRPLHVSFTWTFAANVFYATCMWGLLVILTRLGSLYIAGQFVFGLSVTAPIFMLTGLQLRKIQATDARQSYSFREYLSVRLVTSLLAVFVVAIVAGLSGVSDSTFRVTLLLALGKFAESISDVIYGFLQQQDRLDRVAKSRILHGASMLFTAATCLHVTASIVLGVGAIVIARWILTFVYDIPAVISVPRDTVKYDDQLRSPDCETGRTNGDSVLAPNRLLTLVIFGLPLGVAAVIASLATNIPRYFVAAYLDIESLGAFGAIASLMIAGVTVFHALDQASCPKLARDFANGNMESYWSMIGRLLLFYVLLGATGVFTTAALGDKLLTCLFGAQFAEYGPVLVNVAFATLVANLAGLIGTILIATRRTDLLLPLAFLNVLTCVVACWVLVPQSGVLGASLALAITKVPFVVAGGWAIFRFPHPTTHTIESANS